MWSFLGAARRGLGVTGDIEGDEALLDGPLERDPDRRVDVADGAGSQAGVGLAGVEAIEVLGGELRELVAADLGDQVLAADPGVVRVGLGCDGGLEGAFEPAFKILAYGLLLRVERMAGFERLLGLGALAPSFGLRLAVEALCLVLAGDLEARLPRAVRPLTDRALPVRPFLPRHRPALLSPAPCGGLLVDGLRCCAC